MDIVYEIKCPECGGSIMELDHYDTEYEGDRDIHKCVGECLACGLGIQYDIVYVKSSVEVKSTFEG